MRGFLNKALLALRLGLPAIAQVSLYRIGLKTGLHPVCRLRAESPVGPFFTTATPVPGYNQKNKRRTSSIHLFGHFEVDLTRSPPDWHKNPITNQAAKKAEDRWWEINEFDSGTGDIKAIWELSRMGWAMAFAQQAQNGDETAIARLNEWLGNWCRHNTPYRGLNWKCGQEASIRVMNLIMAAMILQQDCKPLKGLKDLVQLHLKRIAPTIQYAVAQKNNHGTSEAAALFIGGSWLASVGESAGTRWQIMGRHWIEKQTPRLIGPHGSFSQYSLNYHRLMLDTMSLVKIWQNRLNQRPFSQKWGDCVSEAARWIFRMTNSQNGDGPNVGANDGAQLLPLAGVSYRDFRPSVQLAFALFSNLRAYSEDGPWNNLLRGLGVPLPQKEASPPNCYIADDGGFAMLRNQRAMAMLRYPRFKFRPSQADALHLDLWLDDENILCDAGTYSYNTDPKWMTYFSGTASHNTIQFDGRDQMPRLGRFLFGNWLKTLYMEPLSTVNETTKFSAGYRDDRGATHRRQLSMTESKLMIRDKVSGFSDKAVLRWKLAPGNWTVEGNENLVRLIKADGDWFSLAVESDIPLSRFELVEGWRSLHYLKKESVPVLEVEVNFPGILTTEVSWKK